MRTIKQGILGDFSGKVGPVIGGVWKGIGYMGSILFFLSRINDQEYICKQVDQKHRSVNYIGSATA